MHAKELAGGRRGLIDFALIDFAPLLPSCHMSGAILDPNKPRVEQTYRSRRMEEVGVPVFSLQISFFKKESGYTWKPKAARFLTDS